METKKGADSLEIWLCNNGFPATSIHGDRTQQVLSILFSFFFHFFFFVILMLVNYTSFWMHTVAVLDEIYLQSALTNGVSQNIWKCYR